MRLEMPLKRGGGGLHVKQCGFFSPFKIQEGKFNATLYCQKIIVVARIEEKYTFHVEIENFEQKFCLLLPPKMGGRGAKIHIL